MPTLFCCILNCETESTNINPKRRKIFYRFPQNSDRKQLWLSQIGGEYRIKYGNISSNSRICNAHFATGKPNLDSNHVDYVPTLFPWSTKEERTKVFQAVEQYEMKIKELEQKILAKAFLNVSNETSSTAANLTNESIKTEKTTEQLNNNSYHGNNNSNHLLSNKNYESNTIPISTQQQNIITESNNENNNSNNNLNSNLSASVLQYILNSLALASSNYNTTQNVNNLDVNKTDSVVESGTSSVTITTTPLNLSQSFCHNNNNNDNDKNVKLENLEITSASQNINENENSVGINDFDNSTTVTTTTTTTKQSSTNNANTNSIDIHQNPAKNGGEYTNENVSTTESIGGTPNNNLVGSNNSSSISSNSNNNNNNGRSCTCTKSGCLKLYCECFSSGNVCTETCSCINCHNNGKHAEERAKIVNLYLERDPSVFNSKIEFKEVGKKHSKGCNCLKSSCLKNYCECFENKVLCSNLCRCRRCLNTDNITKNTSKCSSSRNSESTSIISENSPQASVGRRKRKAPKSHEMYEDVSSIESDVDTVKQSHIDIETVSPMGSSTSITSTMDTNPTAVDSSSTTIPSFTKSKSSKLLSTNSIPTSTSNIVKSSTTTSLEESLPRETDYTEEELALMHRLRQQRNCPSSNSSIVKAESIPEQTPITNKIPPPFSLTTNQNTPLSLVTNQNSKNQTPQTPSSFYQNPIAQSTPNSSSSRHNNNLSFPNNEMKQISSTVDLLQLLVAQQLLSSSSLSTPKPPSLLPTQPPPQIMVANNNNDISSCLATLMTNTSNSTTNNIHLITKSSPSSSSKLINVTTTNNNQTAAPSSHPIKESSNSNSTNSSLSSSNNLITTNKLKMSAEDYVRKHIEAAERAVRADNLRKESLTNNNCHATSSNCTTTSSVTHATHTKHKSCINSTPTITTTLTKQKVKIEPFSSNSKSIINKITSHQTNNLITNQNRPPIKIIGTNINNKHSIILKSNLTKVDFNNSSSSIASAAAATSSSSSSNLHNNNNNVKHNQDLYNRKKVKKEIKSIKSDISNIKLRMLIDRNKIRNLQKSVNKLQSILNKY